jgi:GT2 family glycosyltransferase
MPTADRPRWVPQAIRYFLRQDYPNRELVILDDGEHEVQNLIPIDPRIRYKRLHGKRTLGAKQNLCVAESRGDLVLHWDDDDWFAAHRISSQVDALLRGGSEVCGLPAMLFHQLRTGRTWRYELHPGHGRPWLAGGSLLYTKDFWSRSPFPDRQVGSDTEFVWSQSLAGAAMLADHEIYIAMIHDRNSSPKIVQSNWTPWHGDLRRIMGDDFDFYDFARKPPRSRTSTSGFPGLVDVILPRQASVEDPRRCIENLEAQTDQPIRLSIDDSEVVTGPGSVRNLATDVDGWSRHGCRMTRRAEIIVPTFAQESFTIRCFDTLIAHTAGYRLVWVDNGSAAESRAAVFAHFECHADRLAIWSAANLGYVGGTNLGLRAVLDDAASEAEYVVLLNNDTELTPYWLDRLIGVLEQNPTIGAAGPMTSPSESSQAWPHVFSSRGERPPESLATASSAEVSRALAERFGDAILDVPMVAFFCTVFRKRVFEEIGLLDPRFGAGLADDDDYCLRLRRAGYVVAFVPGAYVIHHHRTTFRSIYSDTEIAAMQSENLARYRLKHGVL